MQELIELQTKKQSLTAKYNRAGCAWVVGELGFCLTAFGGVAYLTLAPNILDPWINSQEALALGNKYLLPVGAVAATLSGLLMFKAQHHGRQLDEVNDQIDIYEENHTDIVYATIVSKPSEQDYEISDNPYQSPRSLG